jgi:hypothetical protein
MHKNLKIIGAFSGYSLYLLVAKVATGRMSLLSGYEIEIAY